MKLPVSHAVPFAVLIFLASCSAGGGSLAAPPPPPAANGPAADYPVVTGDPFTIDGTTYTPVDKLNYDAVGYAAIGSEGGGGISGAHKTLPLPSYVEVTSLTSGKTILVRIERRGPMTNDLLVELSPGAADQLGIAGMAKAPVRVRRVNPPEAERAMLRGGQPAPGRMDTPKSLLAVLMRKLGTQESVNVAPPEPAKAEPVKAEPAKPGHPDTYGKPLYVPPPAGTPTPVSSPVPAPAPAAPVKAAITGSYLIQVATFSSQDRADKAAASLKGSVKPAGRFWRMILGPFASKAEAAAALAKAKGAGYSDARIQRAD